MLRMALVALLTVTATAVLAANREDPRMHRPAKIEAFICSEGAQPSTCAWNTVLGMTLIETYGDVRNPIITTKEMTLRICNVVLKQKMKEIQAQIARDHASRVITVREIRCTLADVHEI